MNQESVQTNEIFMDTIVKKAEQQDQKIAELDRKVAGIPDYTHQLWEQTENTRQILKTLGELKAILPASHFPAEKIQELSQKLNLSITRLEKPVENKVRHHHHVPKVLWLAAALFAALCLACCGWHMSASASQSYQMSNIELRFLKLKSPSELRQYLYTIDSMYRSGYAMKDSVIQWEADEQEAFELVERLQQKQDEGREAKEKLETLERRNADRRKVINSR